MRRMPSVWPTRKLTPRQPPPTCRPPSKAALARAQSAKASAQATESSTKQSKEGAGALAKQLLAALQAAQAQYNAAVVKQRVAKNNHEIALKVGGRVVHSAVMVANAYSFIISSKVMQEVLGFDRQADCRHRLKAPDDWEIVFQVVAMLVV
jgi:hypothetical protein